MEECNICLTKMKKQNRNRHNQSKKHIYFSNLIINKYILKNDEIIKFKDILQSYYDEHKKKFNEFTVYLIWKKNNMIINKISVPCTVTIQKKTSVQTNYARNTHVWKCVITRVSKYTQ